MARYRVLVDCVSGRELVGDRWENRYYTATVIETDSLEEAEREVERLSVINPQQRFPRVRTID